MIELVAQVVTMEGLGGINCGIVEFQMKLKFMFGELLTRHFQYVRVCVGEVLRGEVQLWGC